MQKDFYQLTITEIYSELKTSMDWLGDDEVADRLKKFWPNKIMEVGGSSIFSKVFHQFKDFMIVLLIVTCGLSIYLWEIRSAVVLWIIVFFNIVIGFLQEYKAGKIMDSLKSLVHPSAKVIRKWKMQEIAVQDLVPGDVVMLEAGDSVPADLRVIESSDFWTNDFALTWESNPVRKIMNVIRGKATLWKRTNMLYMWTTVAMWSGKGIVVTTWHNTILWDIARLSSETETDTSPLQKEINNISLKLTIWTIVLSSILFVLALSIDLSVFESFSFALGIAMALVPQWLPAQISIALSLASQRLSKHDVVVKKLSSVETLWSTTIICTDKTWTLTTNQMTVEEILLWKKLYHVSGSWFQPVWHIVSYDWNPVSSEFKKQWKFFFQGAVFASTAHVVSPDENHKQWYVLWDPTEWALLTMSSKMWFSPEVLRKNYKELVIFPFDSDRKKMSSLRQCDKDKILFVKWSPRSIIDSCTHIFDWEKVSPIKKDDIDFYIDQCHFYSEKAMRTLAFAYKNVKWDDYSSETDPNDVEQWLTFLGVVFMLDPPRQEVPSAMKSAYQAFIDVSVVTWDSALTAKAIAQKVGMENDWKPVFVIKWEELENMTDKEILEKFDHNHVLFSRTAPVDKLRIVSILKKAGHVVAVTGDWINDAPALKRADIWVAMWITWTDVAKDASELILLKDSFGSLVYAIQEWRIIFQNIKKTILSSLTSNGGELFVVLLSLLFASIWWWPMAITPLLILCIDLVWEMLPLMALTWDPAQKWLMSQAPRKVKEHILTKSVVLDLLFAGFLMWLIPFIMFYLHFWFMWVPLWSEVAWTEFYAQAVTVTYVSLLFCQYANILSRRAGLNTVFTKYFFSNKKLLLSLWVSILVVMSLMYVPAIANVVGAKGLYLWDWWLALFAGILYLTIREVQKYFRRKN